MKTSYVELLKQAKENNINATKLFVADNVICDVMNSINEALKTEEEINELVETISALVYDFYLDTYGLAIRDISRALCEMHFDEEIDLDDIDRTMVYEKIKSFHLG